MGLANIREELHQLINQADESLINRIYDFIKSEHSDMSLTPEQERDLEQRILRHERGESKSYTWEETLEKIKRKEK